MNVLEIIVIATLGLLLLEQSIGLGIFLVICRRRPQTKQPARPLQALIVLSLRGADPFLENCLRGACTQDHPNHKVRVIVDHRQDPAWEIVERVVAETRAEHVEVMLLESPASTCSLKCSAVYQATADLDDECEAVAFLDADVIPQRSWLRHLVAPLADERIGAAMGNRWYQPDEAEWGSLVRQIWNMIAVPTMYFWQVPWGGSLAVKASVLRESDLRERWLHAGCDDMPLVRVLRKLGLRSQFVPRLMMVNQEDCNLSTCIRFVSRQMTWTRLYYPECWWASNIFFLLFTGSFVLAAVLAVTAAMAGRWTAANSLGLVLLGFLVASASLLSLFEYAMRPLVLRREKPTPLLRLKALAAIPFTQIVLTVSTWWSLLARRIEWRGIEYELHGPWDIRLVEYRPHESSTPGTEEVNVEAHVS